MGGGASKTRGNIREKDDGSVKNSERRTSGPYCSRSGPREKVGSVQVETSETDMMVFAFKEAEWKQENKILREEVKMLRKMVEEKEEKIRGMEEAAVEGMADGGGGDDKSRGGGKEWEVLVVMLAEQIREERANKKWKQLYHAIKEELDDLINWTHSGNGDVVEELKRVLKVKEEMIADLESRIDEMERELYRKESEIDILRQSLRIMSYKKPQQVTKDIVSTDNSHFVKNFSQYCV